MSESIKKSNLGSYCNLDDRVLQKIAHSESDDLARSRRILERMSNRDAYRCIANKRYKNAVQSGDTTKVQSEICARLPAELKNLVKVLIIPFNYGKRDSDPILLCRFYSKEDPNTAKEIRKDGLSSLLPTVFREHWIQVFCTKERLCQAEMKTLSDGFEEWYKSHEEENLALCQTRPNKQILLQNSEASLLEI